MLIQNACMFQSHAFRDADLRIREGRIMAVRPAGTLRPEAGEAIFDLQGDYLLPGLTDIHSHGALGHDFSDADSAGLHEVLRYEAAHGVTQYCPTSMTLSQEKLLQIFSCGHQLAEAARQAEDPEQPSDEAYLAGFHMEGPYLSRDRLGAQNPDYLARPDRESFEALQKAAGGLIRIVSLAPELPGSLDFIQAEHEQVLISLAHMMASYEEARAAMEAGASHITHLFNAMPGLHHRQPGPIAAAAENQGVTVELIADGIHIHPAMIRLAFALFPGRVTLISDSMRATGLADGVYDLGGQAVTVKGKEARIDTGSLAGSVSNLADCLRLAVSIGIPLEEAIYAATELPASVIGIDDEAGVIREGARANLIHADAQLQFRKIWLNGAALA